MMLLTLATLALLPTKLSTFPLSEVTLLDSPFKRAMELNASVLLKIEPDRLLHNTRLYAGLEPKGKLYGGWEAMGVAGQTLGHYLTALSQQYAATSDKRFRTRIDYIVHEMAVCQKLYGDGYIGALPPLELATLRAIRSGTVHMDGAWVPWYTEHKVLTGLKDAWLVAGCQEAKPIALRLGDWVYDVTKNLSSEQDQQMLGMEHGGMNEALVDLYAQTGDVRYLQASREFYHKAILDPLLAGRDELPGKHANTQIPKVIGMARTYEVTGEPAGRKIAENFWNLVVGKYTYAIGGDSDYEHFFPEKDAAKHLGPQTAESCNTYNMLKLTEHLFKWNPKVVYADFYERALYNHILASQDPKTGMYAYFMSLKPGHFRTFSTLEDSFWCCFGTGMENHTKYGEAIYFHGADELYVNLFIPSVLNWREKRLVLQQQTSYPRDGVVEFSIKAAPGKPIAFHVRCPEWASSAPHFALNGKPLNVDALPGTYASIRRVWHAGDRLQVTIPLSVRTEPLKGDSSKIAFLYGPLVLAGDYGTAPDAYSGDHTHFQFASVPKVYPLVTSDAPGLTKAFVKLPGKQLAWRISHIDPEGVTLRPYLDLPHDRTRVYWDVFTPDEYARGQKERRAAEEIARQDEARTVDEFRPGEQQSEVDHALASDRSNSGGNGERKWRDARDGGFFSFRLKVLPDTPQILRLTYWGDDAGRTFDILVDGQKLTTQTLDGSHSGQLFAVDLPLSHDQLSGKSAIEVRFQAPASGFAGGLFGAAILKAKG